MYCTLQYILITGKALNKIGDFQRSFDVLNKAQTIKPSDRCISEQLREVENKRRLSKQRDKAM